MKNNYFIPPNHHAGLVWKNSLSIPHIGHAFWGLKICHLHRMTISVQSKFPIGGQKRRNFICAKSQKQRQISSTEQEFFSKKNRVSSFGGINERENHI
jgi:hypothetical protein